MPPFEEGTARGFVRRAGGGSISVSAVLATNAALPATLFDGELAIATERLSPKRVSTRTAGDGGESPITLTKESTNTTHVKSEGNHARSKKTKSMQKASNMQKVIRKQEKLLK